MSDEEVTVAAPAHITGLFAAYPATDPLEAGSIGAGLALEDGVVVTVDSTKTSGLFLDGDPTSMRAPALVLEAFDVDLHVEIDAQVPLGAGFGVSGAAALGVAHAVNDIVDAMMTENELVKLAHRADVEAGTGLGDVVAQARGGVPLRLEPGAPGYGKMDGIPAQPTVEYTTMGELSTADVLKGDLARINTAGRAAMERVQDRPTVDTFMTESATFARESGLLDDEIAAIIDRVDRPVSMAMLGRTVFGLDNALSAEGIDARESRVSPAGVHYVD